MKVCEFTRAMCGKLLVPRFEWETSISTEKLQKWQIY